MPQLNSYEQQIQKIRDLGITPYGSFFKAYLTPNSVQRVRLFSMFGFRCVMTPQHWSMTGENRAKKLALGILGFALDNGAYICHTTQTPFPTEEFEYMVKDVGHGADWVAVPDVVANKEATLRQAPHWVRRCRELSPSSRLLLVYQDGMTESDIRPYLEDGVGIFIGGSDEAKQEAMKWVPGLCRLHEQYCHVGRVNTQRRIQRCLDVGANSFDGSSYSVFLPSFAVVQNIINQNGQMSLFNRSNHDEQMCRKSLRHRDEILDAFNITQEEVESYVQSAQEIPIDGVGNRKVGSKKYRDLAFFRR